jgi:hypothetical protein
VWGAALCIQIAAICGYVCTKLGSPQEAGIWTASFIGIGIGIATGSMVLPAASVFISLAYTTHYEASCLSKYTQWYLPFSSKDRISCAVGFREVKGGQMSVDELSKKEWKSF